MPIPLYSPLIGNQESQLTDFRTGLAASTTDLGGGNGAAGKVGIDVNLAGLGGSPSSGGLPVSVINSLIPVAYDEIDLTSYTTDNQPITVLYKKAAVLVATLTLGYSGGAAGGNLTSVVRT